MKPNIMWNHNFDRCLLYEIQIISQQNVGLKQDFFPTKKTWYA